MKSLTKSLDILGLFLLPEREELSITDLAELSGQDKGNVKRILDDFIEYGFIIQNGTRGKYSLGPKFLDYSGLIKKRSKIREKALPYMVKLARSTKESVVLTLFDLNKKMGAYSQIIPSDNVFKIVPDEATKVPLYCSCVGKVFLADMTNDEIQNYLDTTELKPYTERTITHPEYLKAQIAIVAKEGVAFDNEEMTIGVKSIASGIRNDEGRVVAAIGVVGWVNNLNHGRTDKIVSEIKECAELISKELGYRS